MVPRSTSAWLPVRDVCRVPVGAHSARASRRAWSRSSGVKMSCLPSPHRRSEHVLPAPPRHPINSPRIWHRRLRAEAASRRSIGYRHLAPPTTSSCWWHLRMLADAPKTPHTPLQAPLHTPLHTTLHAPLHALLHTPLSPRSCIASTLLVHQRIAGASLAHRCRNPRASRTSEDSSRRLCAARGCGAYVGVGS